MTPARIPDDVRAHVKARDNGCLGPAIGMQGRCEGGLQIDHILNGGLGRKCAPEPKWLASLCVSHHRIRTENGRQWRPVLLAKVAELEDRILDGLWPAGDEP